MSVRTFLALLGAFLIGCVATFLVMRRYRTQVQVGRSSDSSFGAPVHAENIRFLYENRLKLFNTRREHQLKIYFGAWVLLGALDAPVVARYISVPESVLWGWVLMCLAVFGVVWGFDAAIQVRNRTDRTALNELYNRICDFGEVAPGKSPREVADLNPFLSFLYFHGHMLLLFLAAVVSAYLPFVVGP